MEAYILDTNLFFNLEIDSGFGKSSEDVIKGVTRMCSRARVDNRAEMFMPPSVLKEFMTFVSEKDDYIRDFLGIITVKAPTYEDVSFSSQIFYNLVEEMRHRSYRGLQVAEEELINAGKSFQNEGHLDHISFQKKIGTHVTKLRDHYRQATRHRFLDSVSDLDIIVLAKELNGCIVSADEGVIRWARSFGVKEVMPSAFKKRLDALGAP